MYGPEYVNILIRKFFGGNSMIEPWQVREALRSRLGSFLVDEPGFAEPLSSVLNAYASYRDSFADLASRVEDTLFNTLYNHLGSGMSVRMDNGSLRRVRTAELRDAADDIMGVFFEQLKVYSVNYDALHSYMMESGSFSAMKTLYLHYADLMPSEERTLLARVIKGARPQSEWEEWLLPENKNGTGTASRRIYNE